VREHRGSDRGAVGGPDVSGPTGRGMGRHPAAGAGHVDTVSPGWLPAVVSLQRPDQWPVLRAPGRAALQRRRALCVPNLLWPAVRKPTRISAAPRAGQGAEDSSSVGRQREHVRRFPGKAEGHAPANLHPASPFSRYRCISLWLLTARVLAQPPGQTDALSGTHLRKANIAGTRAALAGRAPRPIIAPRRDALALWRGRQPFSVSGPVCRGFLR
jgi:hypothetical protein